MSKAQGQFTIIDYNDALTLTGYIGSNLAKTQMYNPDNDSYSPDWTSKNLVLTLCHRYNHRPDHVLGGNLCKMVYRQFHNCNHFFRQLCPKWYEESYFDR